MVEPVNHERDQGSSKPRTRKAEIVSGLTVVVSVPILALAVSIYRELRESRRADSAAIEQRIRQAESACVIAVAEERDRARDRESELQADIRELRTQILNLRGRR
jgi:hypothetical protein